MNIDEQFNLIAEEYGVTDENSYPALRISTKARRIL